MNKLVSRYYAFQLFFTLLFWVPVFYEVQKRIGLNDAQIFDIQSIYYVAFIFMEVPTGLIADRFGHRLCLQIGSLVLIGCNLLPIFIPSYDGFLAHFLTLGLARSFISGASLAYLQDGLQNLGAPERFREIEGDAKAFSLIGKIVCWAIVGYTMSWNLLFPYWLTAGAAMLAFAFAVALPRFPNDFSNASAVKVPPFEFLSELLRAPVLVTLMFQGIAIFVLGRVCQTNLFQPILSQKQFALTSFGLIMAAMTVFEAAGSYWNSWLLRFVSATNSVFALTLAMTVALVSLPFSNSIGTVICFLLFSYFSGLVYPLQRQLIINAIGASRYRATLMSIESIIDRAVCALFIAFLGHSLQRGELKFFLYLCGAATLGLMIITFVVLLRLRPRDSTPKAEAA